MRKEYEREAKGWDRNENEREGNRKKGRRVEGG